MNADRATALAVVADHHGHAATDDVVLARVFRRFGWEMLTEDALAMLAREYERQANLSERIAADNRALAKTAGAR